MQNAETVLHVYRERGKRGLPLERVYRQLFNPQLFLMAYANLYGNTGAMTRGTTEETVDAMSVAKIDRIIRQLRDERYRWKPVRRVSIPKKKRKNSAIGNTNLVGQTGARGYPALAGGLLRASVFQP